MYCPKCGQQQVTDTTRFCSRCGLPIHGLSEWVERDGISLVRDDEAQPRSSRKRVCMKRGAKLLFVSLILTPLFFALSFVADSPGPLFVPLTFFLAGLSFMLYTLIFGDESPRVRTSPARPATFRSGFSTAALGPGKNDWVNSLGGRPVSTSELAQPSSVTEHTTKLLVDD